MKSQLVNIQGQLESIVGNKKPITVRVTSPLRGGTEVNRMPTLVTKDLSIDQMFRDISERIHAFTLNERDLKAMIDHLESENGLRKKESQLQQKDNDEKRRLDKLISGQER